MITPLLIIVSAILGTFGMIKNNVMLLLLATIISPIGVILHDISSGIVHQHFQSTITNFAMLTFAIIITVSLARIGYRSRTSQARKIDDFNETKLFHIAVSSVVGILTTYLTIVAKKSTAPIVPQVIGIIIGIAGTLLTPLVDIGLNINQSSIVINDLKIFMVNVLGFMIGAGIVHYVNELP